MYLLREMTWPISIYMNEHTDINDKMRHENETWYMVVLQMFRVTQSVKAVLIFQEP